MSRIPISEGVMRTDDLDLSDAVHPLPTEKHRLSVPPTGVVSAFPANSPGHHTSTARLQVTSLLNPPAMSRIKALGTSRIKVPGTSRPSHTVSRRATPAMHQRFSNLCSSCNRALPDLLGVLGTGEVRMANRSIFKAGDFKLSTPACNRPEEVMEDTLEREPFQPTMGQDTPRRDSSSPWLAPATLSRSVWGSMLLDAIWVSVIMEPSAQCMVCNTITHSRKQ